MADISQLQARLAEAEAAYHQLVTGAMTASVGAGDQQVAFTRFNLPDLRNYMAELRAQITAALGLSRAGSRRLEIIL